MDFRKTIKDFIESYRIKIEEAKENANTHANDARIEYQDAKKERKVHYNEILHLNYDLNALKEENYEIHWKKHYADTENAHTDAKNRIKKAVKKFNRANNDIVSAERKLALLNWLSPERNLLK